MNKDEQRIAIAKACGWMKDEDGWWDGSRRMAGQRTFRLPDYLSDHNAMQSANIYAGIHDRGNLEVRVKWVNHLRAIVSRRCPKNKVGSPIVSDVDVLTADAGELAEALLRVLKLWKKENTKDDSPL